MVSKSSKSAIQARAIEFWFTKEINCSSHPIPSKFEEISNFIDNEYAIIPKKERIGKGLTFIIKSFISILFSKKNLHQIVKISEETSIDSLKNEKMTNFEKTLLNFGLNMLEWATKKENKNLLYFGIHFIGEIATLSESTCHFSLKFVEKWADHPNWEIRENSLQIVRKALKKYTEITLEYLKSFIESSNPNIRRLVAEGTRPLRDIMWLRDPNRNKPILSLLSLLKADPSQYVRKAVGNNLKDLSKYMPEIIITLCKDWINGNKIANCVNLASKSKKELGSVNYYLIWTIKFALRWVKDRNPKFHDDIKKILGENYILYYNEKGNIYALPK